MARNTGVVAMWRGSVARWSGSVARLSGSVAIGAVEVIYGVRCLVITEIFGIIQSNISIRRLTSFSSFSLQLFTQES